MLTKIKQRLAALHRDERGAMSVEKVLILAIIALPILIVLYGFRQTIVGWFQNNAGKIKDDNQ